MFVTLLIVVFVVAVLVSTIVVLVFDKPIKKLLSQTVSDDLAGAWTRYLKLAIYVVGVSGGVRVWQLERYISKRTPTDEILQLNRERWIVEIYGTVIGTLQSTVWLLLVFFVFALIAYVLMRALESRRVKTTQ